LDSAVAVLTESLVNDPTCFRVADVCKLGLLLFGDVPVTRIIKDCWIGTVSHIRLLLRRTLFEAVRRRASTKRTCASFLTCTTRTTEGVSSSAALFYFGCGCSQTAIDRAPINIRSHGPFCDTLMEFVLLPHHRTRRRLRPTGPWRTMRSTRSLLRTWPTDGTRKYPTTSSCQLRSSRCCSSPPRRSRCTMSATTKHTATRYVLASVRQSETCTHAQVQTLSFWDGGWLADDRVVFANCTLPRVGPCARSIVHRAPFSYKSGPMSFAACSTRS
jgi:hypothetical protein